jgi:hypothetical protein
VKAYLEIVPINIVEKLPNLGTVVVLELSNSVHPVNITCKPNSID